MGIYTVKDVARRAGVSAMTVSRVLNNTGSVSEATRERVLEAARELQYYRNSVARSLRVNETRTIGAVLSDSSEMVISQVLRGIQDAAQKHDYSIITANTDHSLKAEREAVETLISKQIDGLILVAPLLYASEDITWLRERNIPVVMLMRKSEDGSVDTVMNDNFHGGYELMRHLCEQGCRRFMFLTLKDSLSGRIRLEGSRKAMQEWGIKPEDCDYYEITQYLESGYQATRTLIPRLQEFDALVCGCDTAAVGAMRALHEAGIHIPEDICVTGYDGIDIGQYLAVPLSTFAQPFYEIGEAGAEVLLSRIHNPDAPVKNQVFTGKLTPRQSTMRHPLCTSPVEEKA